MNFKVHKRTTKLLKHCARCGKNHRNIEWKKLTHPILTADYNFTHYAICPNNKQPIVMRFI